MVLKYDLEVSINDIYYNIDRLTNQVFKLLPCREENGDWKTPLENIILELVGMNNLFQGHPKFFSLLCKLEALLTLTEENDFLLFRKTIFECLGMMNRLKECL
jgi:hypothetical protein